MTEPISPIRALLSQPFLVKVHLHLLQTNAELCYDSYHNPYFREHLFRGIPRAIPGFYSNFFASRLSFSRKGRILPCLLSRIVYCLFIFTAYIVTFYYSFYI